MPNKVCFSSCLICVLFLLGPTDSKSQSDKPSTNIHMPSKEVTATPHFHNVDGGKLGNQQNGNGTQRNPPTDISQLANDPKISQVSIDAINRLKALNKFMDVLTLVQAGRILKRFLEFPTASNLDKVRKISNGELKELLQQLADIPKQERDIASPILDNVIFSVDQAMGEASAKGNKVERDQLYKEYQFWNKFQDGLNFIPAKSKQSSLMMIMVPDLGTVASTSSTHSRVTMLNSPLRMRLKESDTGGFQALSPNMVNFSDILIYPIFSLINVPCWGIDLTVNVYTSVYEHDPENISNSPIPFEDLESKEDFELFDSYKVPGLSIASQFLLTKNSGLFLPDFFYKGSSPNTFYITIDNEKFEDTDGIFDFYFYYTLTVDNVTSEPSSVYKIVHRL